MNNDGILDEVLIDEQRQGDKESGTKTQVNINMNNFSGRMELINNREDNTNKYNHGRTTIQIN